MIRAFAALAFVTVAAALFAQPNAPASAAPAPEGLEAPWTIAPVLQEIGAHFSRLLAALERIDTKSWVDKGAPEAYGEQVQSCKLQAKALSDGATALARNPEQLAAALELFFRFQGVETMLSSVEEGMRKYESPADAQALASLEAEEGANRDRFQRYIVSLAADRERQLKITNEEAQRCRGILTAPAPATAKSRKKN